MVPFAGYDMPVQYADGIIAEHTWTRTNAGLFDVSHMGQARLVGPDHASVAAAIEALVPAEITGLAPGRQRYSQLTNDDGGIIDDLMIARPADPAHDGQLLLVVNAARKEVDFAHIAERLPGGIELVREDERALIALQGPRTEAILSAHVPGIADMSFMQSVEAPFGGIACRLSRSGYTGEYGFEISVEEGHAEQVWAGLSGDQWVRPVGLGARDTLRLEASLCLYGSDIDETTSPVEAGLEWSIGKRRREEGGFPGAGRIQRELAVRPSRRRVGIRPQGKAPARAGTVIADMQGNEIGVVTSGGFGPTVGAPIAMGYVMREHALPGTRIALLVRGRELAAEVVDLPFVRPRFHRAN